MQAGLGKNRELLLWHLILFDFVYPGRADYLPHELMSQLFDQARRRWSREWNPRAFRGTLLESLSERLNIIPDLPLRASAAQGEVAANLTHPFQIRSAGGARLAGLINNNPAMIDLLFELAHSVIDVDAALAVVVALHERLGAAGPTFLFVGPSDMEFVGLELRA